MKFDALRVSEGKWYVSLVNQCRFELQKENYRTYQPKAKQPNSFNIRFSPIHFLQLISRELQLELTYTRS